MESSKPFYKECANCSKVFKAKSSYYCHKKTCEEAAARDECLTTGSYLCLQESCSFVTNVKVDFLKHLKESHSICGEEEYKTFQDYAEFEDWKENYEKATTAFFALNYTSRNKKGMLKQFVCNRSGQYKSKRTGIRKVKSQGLIKIGHKCTASIKIQLYENSSTVTATVYGMHYGHENNLAHLRISKSDRLNIANQLSMGIEKPRILSNIFSNNPTEHLERIHLTTMKDICNIEKSFGMEQVEKQPEDSISVDAYVSEYLEGEKTIYLYQKQGESSLHHLNQESCPLDNDIALDIVTNFENNTLQSEITSDVGNDLTDLKSNLVSKVMTLCKMIQGCDNSDLLVATKAHITGAISLLKGKDTEAGKSTREKSIPSHKTKQKKKKSLKLTKPKYKSPPKKSRFSGRNIGGGWCGS